MIKHIKECTFGLLELLYSCMKDLKSFRNKLTVFVCFFAALCVWYNRDNTTVVISCIAFLDSYLIYYLHNRKKNDPKR